MKSLKKFFALCLTLALVLSLAACGNDAKPSADGNRVTLTVFAAASLTESLNAIERSIGKEGNQ